MISPFLPLSPCRPVSIQPGKELSHSCIVEGKLETNASIGALTIQFTSPGHEEIRLNSKTIQLEVGSSIFMIIYRQFKPRSFMVFMKWMKTSIACGLHTSVWYSPTTRILYYIFFFDWFLDTIHSTRLVPISPHNPSHRWMLHCIYFKSW